MSRLKPVEPLAQADHDLQQPQDQHAEIRSPWLTTAEACEYLRFTGRCRLRSLYRFLATKGIPTARRGHAILVARRDLDAAVTGRRRA
jgi:excisionase family DNA binding protein